MQKRHDIWLVGEGLAGERGSSQSTLQDGRSPHIRRRDQQVSVTMVTRTIAYYGGLWRDYFLAVFLFIEI